MSCGVALSLSQGRGTATGEGRRLFMLVGGVCTVCTMTHRVPPMNPNGVPL